MNERKSKIIPFESLDDQTRVKVHAIHSTTYNKFGTHMNFEAWVQKHSRPYDGKFEKHVMLSYTGSHLDHVLGYRIFTDSTRVDGGSWSKIIESGVNAEVRKKHFGFNEFALMMREMAHKIEAENIFTEISCSQMKYCDFLLETCNFRPIDDIRLLDKLVKTFLLEHKVNISVENDKLVLSRDSSFVKTYKSFPVYMKHTGQNFDHTGVSAVIFDHDEKVLLQHRRNLPYFSNCWFFPSGKVSSNEAPHEAIVREVSEETSLEIEITREVMRTAKGNVRGISYGCKIINGTARNMEPDKFSEIGYFSLDKLPVDTHTRVHEVLAEYKKYKK